MMRNQSNTRAPRAAPQAPGRDPRLRALAFIVPALFFVKAAVLGLRIVSRWDVPDETAHFDYARDLWSGRGIARIGEAKIDADIATDLFKRPTGPVDNWTAHHPPTYYVLAGAAWKAATLVTQDENWLFRAPRLVSAFFGALTIFFIYKIVHSVGLGEASAVAVAGGFAAVPTFAWMSSGTNHDTMVAALGTASAWQFSDFMLSRRARSAWLSVLLMSFAAATKITAVPVLAALVGCLALEARASDGALGWLVRVAAWSAAGLALPAVWLVRSQLLYGAPFALFPSVMGAFVRMGKPLQIGLLGFLETTTQMEDIFVNFVGRIGWIGKAAGRHTWFPIQAPYLTVYEIVGLLLTALAAVWMVCGIRLALDGRAGLTEPTSLLGRLQPRLPRAARNAWIALVATSIAAAAVLSPRIVSTATASWLLVPLVALCIGLVLLGLCVVVVPSDAPRRLALYAALVCGFLGVILLLQGHSAYVLDGEMHFAHGRYLYPVLGFLVCGTVMPALFALGRLAERAASTAAVVIWLAYAALMLNVAVPYALGRP